MKFGKTMKKRLGGFESLSKGVTMRTRSIYVLLKKKQRPTSGL